MCPFALFYELKPLCDTCYFVGVFPKEYVKHADYVIESVTGDDNKQITDFLDHLKTDTTVTVTAVDSCESPSLRLYKIERAVEKEANR